MDEWMDTWMDGWTHGWMDGWIDEWIHGWMDGWIDEWMNGYMDGWIHGANERPRFAKGSLEAVREAKPRGGARGDVRASPRPARASLSRALRPGCCSCARTTSAIFPSNPL